MNPISFPGANVVYGEGQPEYQPLPALKLPDYEGTVVTCWAVSDHELEQIMEHKKIYLKQLTFNGELQPILPMADLGDDIIMNYE